MYKFIELNQEEFGVRWLLRRFNIYPNSYYNYLKYRRSEYDKRKQFIQDRIKRIFHSENGKMGYRMIKLMLEKEKINISLLTVHKYMKDLNLKSISFRKRPKYVKGTVHKVFKNLLKRDFKAHSKNLKWCTDFTYIHLTNGKTMYNCCILDLYDRSIVASKTSTSITSELAIQTLKEALDTHKPKPGLLLHSDQGSQFTSKDFTSFCESNKIQQSMSKAGCPYDNAPMESFYGKLKSEHLNHYEIKDSTQLNELTTDYIFRYYHHKRPHSSLGGLTPFEKRYLKS